MDKEQLIEIITKEIYKILIDGNLLKEEELLDISSQKYKNQIRLENIQNQEAMHTMRQSTTARIGVGKTGPRLNTKMMLALRADHANAKDAVLRNVNEEILDKLNLFMIQTKCATIDEHLTRPDYGKQFEKKAVEEIIKKCSIKPRVQIIVSDGLSSTAVNENIENILPVIMEGLKDLKIEVGTPFFVKYGRVAIMDSVSEILDPEVVCILIGERPGLAAADSMSAYIAYNAKVGMPEAKRTVISNIHKGGIPAIEAGAYLVEVISRMLEEKKSGVDLRL